MIERGDINWFHGDKELYYAATGKPVTPFDISLTDYPDMFTQYGEGFIKGMIARVLADECYYALFTINYEGIWKRIRRVLAGEMYIEDVTPHRTLDSLMFSLVIPFESIPLHLNKDYPLQAILQGFFRYRLEHNR